jgi:hypothetical protein
LEELDRRKFKELKEEIERATMTRSKILSVLTDLFGMQRAVDVPEQKCEQKCETRSCFSKSIEYFVNQMRLDIVRIPMDR